MRKTVASAAAAALALSVAAASPAVAGRGHDKHHPKPPASGQVDTRWLTDAVTVNGMLQHLRELQTIANRNDGNRASGLPGYDASADYVAKKLEAAGYVVTKQEFTFPFSRDLAPGTLAQVTPEAKDFETQTFDYSGSGDVTGTVVPIAVAIPPGEAGSTTSGCAAADFPDPGADPAVALIQRGTCDFGVKAQNAKDAGYEAAIIFNEGQEGRTELIEGTLGVPVDLPVVGVSYEDGKALAETADATVRVTTSTEVDPERTTSNIIADLPSSVKVTHPDQTVVVGAHLDSVAEGAGINDNGTGSAAILEIAEELAKKGQNGHQAVGKGKGKGGHGSKATLERPVRFAFWGAEEKGLLGSYHYVDSLSSEERAGIYANLNFDMLGSPNYVRFVYDGDGSATGLAGPPGSDSIEKVFTDWFAGKKLASSPTDFDGRSDYGPFIEVGIPAGGLFSGAEGIKTTEEAAQYGGTAGVAYDENYHGAGDDITNINTKGLGELADAAAHATLTLIAAKKGLHPDGSLAPRSSTQKAAPQSLSAPVPGSKHHAVK